MKIQYITTENANNIRVLYNVKGCLAVEDYILLPNSDGTYNLIIFAKSYLYEFGEDFFGKIIKNKKVVIKAIKFIFAGGLVISVPFTDVISAKDNYSMSYVYFGSVLEQIESIKKSENITNTVSPSYFDLNSDGSLKLVNISEHFIEEMHNMKIKVVPFLSNHWSREIGNLALDNRERLANQIADAVEKYNLDGVNVDIENVIHTHREKYTELIRLLKEKMPEKEVSVAVAANPYGWTNGWQGAYDYEKLGKYADYLMIMSYDEHYEGGEPGPVAGYDFVKDSVEYAMKYVPEEKIVMGIPFYGRIWGGGLYGKGISLNRIDELLRLTGAVKNYDEETKSVYANVIITNQEFILNGKRLKPGAYTIWFEDENTIRDKYILSEEYNIKGTGHWSAGQENESIWDYYELWVKGVYFNDIVGHYAKDSIIKVYSEGIMVGKTKGDFYPAHGLTRGEAAVIISRVMGIAPSGGNIFNDTKGHFAERYINSLNKKGVFDGYGDGSFRPNNIITRQEMAVLLSRVLELDYHGTKKYYSDVDNNLWSFEEITALTRAGIMKGYHDGTFKPYNPITRGEAATLIERVLEE